MFRKKQDVTERSRSLLKSSAAKKIKADILAALPLLSKEVLDELMPTKVCRVQITSVAPFFTWAMHLIMRRGRDKLCQVTHG